MKNRDTFFKDFMEFLFPSLHSWLVSVALVPIGWVVPPRPLFLWFTLFSVLHVLLQGLKER